MANQQEIEETYDFMDEIFRVCFGENADLTCAMYNGDFSKILAQAQRDKHDYILDGIRFQPGFRVLDIGCGFGPVLKAVQEAGGQGIGLTLSGKQKEVCRSSDLDVYVRDWKEVTVDTFGTFDGIVSVGAFEHFCSTEEYLAGKQDAIYDHFFRLCHELLPPGGRLYLQTMLLGRNAPEYDRISLQASEGSNEYIAAIAKEFFPGSWLPFGEEHILRVAAPYFFFVIHRALFGLYLGSVAAPNHKGMLVSDKEHPLDFLHQQILSSRNVRSHPITDFWYGGLNYQIEHHLFPTIPRNNLREAQRVVKAFCQEYDIPYHETGFLQSYREIFQHLKQVSASLREK